MHTQSIPTHPPHPSARLGLADRVALWAALATIQRISRASDPDARRRVVELELARARRTAAAERLALLTVPRR